MDWLACSGSFAPRRAEAFALGLQGKAPAYQAFALEAAIPHASLLQGDFVVPLWHLPAIPVPEQPLLAGRARTAVERLYHKALLDRDWPALFDELSREVPVVEVICCFRHPLDAVTPAFREGLERRWREGGCVQSDESAWLADLHFEGSAFSFTVVYHALPLPAPSPECPRVALAYFTGTEAEAPAEGLERMKLEALPDWR